MDRKKGVNLRCIQSLQRMSWLQDDGVGKWDRLQWSILPLPMPPMDFGIIQQRRRLLARRNLREHFSISLEQCIGHLDHLTSNATHDTDLSGIGLIAFIVGAASLDQSFIEPGPLALIRSADHLSHHQKHHLLHRPGTSTGEMGAIKRGSCLFTDRCPAKLRLELSRRGKVVNRADSSDNRGRGNGPNTVNLLTSWAGATLYCHVKETEPPTK